MSFVEFEEALEPFGVVADARSTITGQTISKEMQALFDRYDAAGPRPYVRVACACVPCVRLGGDPVRSFSLLPMCELDDPLSSRNRVAVVRKIY